MELSRSLIIGAVSCLILSVALVVSVAQVPSPLNVDRFDDDASATACTDAPNDCSLRGAIITANARPGADTINLPAGPYRLSISPGGEDTAATGDLDITDSLTIVGAGATVTTIAWLDGPDIVPDRVFHIVSPGITVTISGVTIRNGQANSDGGGILNNATLTLAESVVSDNETSFGYGGGIFSGGANGVASSLSLTNSTVRNNTAPDGGGIFNNGTATLTGSAVSENEALLGEGGYGGYGGYGGGILNGGVDAFDLSDGVFQSTLTLTNSTVNGNMAGSGGGIFNGGGYGGFENNLTLTNTTISGNSADNDGGGIFNNNTTNLNNVTVTNNAADSDNNAVGRGGGIFNGERPGEEFSAGVVNFKNTIIAIDTANRGQGPDCFAPSSSPLISQNYNLIQNTANCVIGGDTSNNITGQSPNLGPLADNGGPTLTHALLVDSPAIDAGNPAGCTDNVGNVLTTDQRGAARPTDGNGDGVAICDIGSYERMAIPADLSITKGDTSDPVNAGEDLTYILTVTNNGPATATGVKVTDTLPAGVRLAISATPSQGSCVASCQLTCELGTISSGGSATVTIIVRPTRPGTFVNVATVSGVQFDPNLGNNETPGIETVVTLPQPATASREIPAVSDFADPLLAYVLIGSPLNLANPDPLTVLQPVLGRPGQGLWRMFRFNPIPAPGKYLEFSAGDPFFNFSQGHGAWLISRDRVTVMMSGDPNDASRRFDIPLQPGRNQIATPFNFSPNFILDWNGCVVPRLQELEIPISPVLVGYEGSEGGYIMTKGGQPLDMEPMFGYWVLNRSSGPVTLPIPPDCVRLVGVTACPAPAGLSAVHIASPLKAGFAAGWRVQLSVAAGEVKDVDNYLGVDVASIDEEDSLDYPEPLPVHGLSLSFPHPEWNESWPHYTTDIRGLSASTNKVWDFEVRADMPRTEVTLYWRSRGGNTPTLTLSDVEGNQIVNMGQARVYTYDSGSGGVRHFQVIAAEK